MYNGNLGTIGGQAPARPPVSAPDDILIFSTILNVIKAVKEFLSQSFEVKDLGEADVILNIKPVK